jgi:hypothetical protein
MTFRASNICFEMGLHVRVVIGLGVTVIDGFHGMAHICAELVLLMPFQKMSNSKKSPGHTHKGKKNQNHPFDSGLV